MKSLKRFFFKYFVIPLARIYCAAFTLRTYGARALIIHGNEILLIKNLGRDYWSLPGGKIEVGEDPEVAALRETEEEIGVRCVRAEAKLGTYWSTKEIKYDTIHVFICTALTRDIVMQWELDDAQWFPIDRLPADTSLATLRRITEYREGKRDVVGEW